MIKFPFKLPMLLDGSTGAMLSAAGMPEGVCPEQWTLENPGVIKRIQQSYVNAGSNAVYSPTFCANRVKLEKYGLADRVSEMNYELVKLSREAVGNEILIGGDMTSLGLFLKPFGEAEFEDYIDVYREQAEALEAAGVDFFIAETLISLAEARAAVIAVRSVSDKPIFITITCDKHGRMLSGTSALAALVTLQGMGIQAFGLNCSTGPDAMVEVIRGLAMHARVPLIVKPNAGLPMIEDGKTIFKLPPCDFTAHTAEFIKLGVSIFGGCCGTDYKYISELKRSLDGADIIQPEDAPDFMCATERDAFMITPGFDFGKRIVCTEYLDDDLMDADDNGAEGVWLHIMDKAGLQIFNESQYLIKRPLKLSAETDTLLLSALRVYNGKAVYSGEADTIKSGSDNLYGMLRI